MIFINILNIFKKRSDNSKITDTILVVAISVIMFSLTLFRIIPYIKVIIISIILFFLVTLLYKLVFYERILAVTLYYFIIIISELTITLLISNILNVNIETITSDYKYSFLTLGIMSKLLTIIIVSIVKRKFSNKSIILPKILHYILIGILLLSSTSMLTLFYVSLSLPADNTQFALFLICLFVLFISIGVLTIYSYANSFYTRLEMETTKSIYNKSYEKFIFNAEKRNDSISKIWHDLNNHIKILDQISDLKIDNQTKYLNSLKDKIESVPKNISSGNNIIDAILNDKHFEASCHGIKFDVKAIAPPELNIDDLDLSSILFNTIDNSIEACINNNVQNKYIYLELYPDGNFLYYKIENSYDAAYHNDSKKIYVNKKENISEGYGLKIIEDIVEKYDGYMDIDKENNKYSVAIILHLNNTEPEVIVT